MVLSCFFTFQYNTEQGIFLDFANFLNDIFCPFAIYSEMYCARRGSFFQHLRVDLVVDVAAVAAVAVVAVGDGAVVVVVVADAIAGATVEAAVAARISKFDVVAAAAGGDDTVAPDASDVSAVADIIDADPDAVDADAVDVDVVVALDI